MARHTEDLTNTQPIPVVPPITAPMTRPMTAAHRSPEPLNPRTPFRLLWWAIALLILLSLTALLASALNYGEVKVDRPYPAVPSSSASPSSSAGPLSTPSIGPTSFPDTSILGPDPLADERPESSPETSSSSSRVVPPDPTPTVTQTSSEPAVTTSDAPPPVIEEDPTDPTTCTTTTPTDTPPDVEDVPVVSCLTE